MDDRDRGWWLQLITTYDGDDGNDREWSGGGFRRVCRSSCQINPPKQSSEPCQAAVAWKTLSPHGLDDDCGIETETGKLARSGWVNDALPVSQPLNTRTTPQAEVLPGVHERVNVLAPKELSRVVNCPKTPVVVALDEAPEVSRKRETIGHVYCSSIHGPLSLLPTKVCWCLDPPWPTDASIAYFSLRPVWPHNKAKREIIDSFNHHESAARSRAVRGE